MLYHYTDFVAFDGILHNAELRLNNILNMNDASEMRLFMNGICKAVVDKLLNTGKTIIGYQTDAFFQKELAKEFRYSAYAACFSRYRDDAAQWERYGHLGQGVCIGFHEDLLQKLLGGAISLQQVYYQENMENHHLVEEFYDVIMQASSFEACISALQGLMKEAWVQSAAFKHPSFSSESELRLVASPFVSNEFAIEPKFHISKDRIKKYYPLDLNKMCQKAGFQLADLVGEIIIGPTSTQSLPILQDYLEDCGLEILTDKISHSKCPLRKPVS